MSLHEIRGKIDSVDSICQITRAMEMVAAGKMRKAEERMAASRHYAQHMRKIIGRLSRSNPEYRHPYMRERPAAAVGYIVVASDRGLCGGLNAGTFRRVMAEMARWHEQGVAIEACTIGNKAEAMLRRTPCRLVAHVSRLGDCPSVADLIGAVRVVLDDFAAGRIDRLFLAYNRFAGMMSQEPVVDQLLPLAVDPEDAGGRWSYLYEQEPRQVVTTVLDRYIESQLYQAVVENLACEQAARTAAMHSASSNAEELMDDLKLDYNKSRQARITQELAEIVGGARASRSA